MPLALRRAEVSVVTLSSWGCQEREKCVALRTGWTCNTDENTTFTNTRQKECRSFVIQASQTEEQLGLGWAGEFKSKKNR